jgi:H+-transporting ATPase
LVDGCASYPELVESADGFAEVFPEHKYEVVDVLQVRYRGAAVQYTGRGSSSTRGKEGANASALSTEASQPPQPTKPLNTTNNQI